MTSTVQRTGVRLPLTLNEKRPQFLQRGCEHRASPLLAASWTGRMDYPTNHLRGARSPLKCNWRRTAGGVLECRRGQRVARMEPAVSTVLRRLTRQQSPVSYLGALSRSVARAHLQTDRNVFEIRDAFASNNPSVPALQGQPPCPNSFANPRRVRSLRHVNAALGRPASSPSMPSRGSRPTLSCVDGRRVLSEPRRRL